MEKQEPQSHRGSKELGQAFGQKSYLDIDVPLDP